MSYRRNPVITAIRRPTKKKKLSLKREQTQRTEKKEPDKKDQHRECNGR